MQINTIIKKSTKWVAEFDKCQSYVNDVIQNVLLNVQNDAQT